MSKSGSDTDVDVEGVDDGGGVWDTADDADGVGDDDDRDFGGCGGGNAGPGRGNYDDSDLCSGDDAGCEGGIYSIIVTYYEHIKYMTNIATLVSGRTQVTQVTGHIQTCTVD